MNLVTGASGFIGQSLLRALGQRATGVYGKPQRNDGISILRQSTIKPHIKKARIMHLIDNAIPFKDGGKIDWTAQSS